MSIYEDFESLHKVEKSSYVLGSELWDILGPVDLAKLQGAVLPHEHILVDFSPGMLPAPPGLEWLSTAQLCMQHLGKIRQYPYSVRQNLVMDQVDEMERELNLFRRAGGGLVCEMSVTGMRCRPHQPDQLAELSRKTGVNIVHATGFYCHNFLPDYVHSMSVKEMRDFMHSEIHDGVGESGVRCGAIYLGCSWPLHSTEVKVLKAAAIVQKETGTPITVHPGRRENSPFQILDILRSEGADVSKVCVAHLERTLSNHSKLIELASHKCYIDISLFGKECSNNQYTPELDYPNDAQRLGMVKALIQAGFREKVMMSQDVVCKHDLQCYGGSGYTHLLEHIVPKMKERGISRDIIDSITMENPKKWLTSAPHEEE